MWKSVLIVAALATFAAAPASAEQCRDARGKFVKCETTKKKVQCKDAKGKFVKCETTKKKVQCKDAKGKFAKCGAAGATPVN